MVTRYCSHDAKEMIANHTEELNKRGTVAGRPVPITKFAKDEKQRKLRKEEDSKQRELDY